MLFYLKNLIFSKKMVDFNAEATIGTPAVDVVRILILQRRSDLLEALEQYHKLIYRDTEADLSVVRARLVSLYIELEAGLSRRVKDESHNELKGQVYSEDIGDIKKAIKFLNNYLDNIRLIRLDNKPNVNKKSWEAVNVAHGY